MFHTHICWYSKNIEAQNPGHNSKPACARVTLIHSLWRFDELSQVLEECAVWILSHSLCQREGERPHCQSVPLSPSLFVSALTWPGQTYRDEIFLLLFHNSCCPYDVSPGSIAPSVWTSLHLLDSCSALSLLLFQFQSPKYLKTLQLRCLS